MPNLSELVQSAKVQIMVYGMSKLGKTFGAGTFPRPNFLDFDSGTATLAGNDFVNKHGWRPGIMYERFIEKDVTKSGIVKGANALDDACRYFDKCMTKPLVDEFDTWVIDTGTTLSEAAMNKAIILLGGTGFGGAKSKTHEEALKYGLVIPKLQDYGSERSMVEQFVKMVKDSGKHVVFLCHEKEITNDQGIITAVVPLLTGKSVEAVSAIFDEVYRLRAKKAGTETVRYLMTKTDGVSKAGSRLGIPDGIEWSWEAIKKAMDETNQLRDRAKKE